MPPKSEDGARRAGDRLCIDLCCGRKGFSRAFAEAGWEVITVDIDPKFEPTIQVDVKDINRTFSELGRTIRHRLADYETVVLVASPPCTSNSKANARAWLKNMGDGLRVAAGCTDMIYLCMTVRSKETFFCLENPTGRLRWFMGTPNSVVKLGNYGKPTWKPTNFWHNIPFKLLEHDMPPTGKHHSQRRQIHLSDLERDPSKRAEMPLGLSQAILEAVEQP